MTTRFIYSNIPADVRTLLEGQEKEIVKSLVFQLPPSLHWHGEQFGSNVAVSYVLYNSIRGEMFGRFRGKNVTGSLAKVFPSIRIRKSRKQSLYIYRIVSLPFRRQSVVVAIRTFSTEKNGKACRRTNNCVWKCSWTSVGSDMRQRATIGGLLNEEEALCAALENVHQHYREAWGRETRSLSLHETRYSQTGRLASSHAVVMH
jgi:hypothetical protein